MIVIHGAVTLNQIISRGRTTTLTDAGAIDAGLSITGQTARRWHTVAQAKEVERQLHELAWYSRHSGGVHINSDEFDIDDGLYELSGVETSMDQVTWGGAIILRVSLTLRRLGGGGLYGPNLTKQVRAIPTLQTNSYSIVSTPRLALPVGAGAFDATLTATRTTKDGAIGWYTGSGLQYTLSGVPANVGECKVFDTGGDATEANWLRVFAPDHTFASAGHCVIENGLVRFIGLTAGNQGAHRVFVWAGGAYTEVTSSTLGDYSALGGLPMTAAYTGLTIEELGPRRLRVKFWGILLTKTITLEMGKPLALVELTSGTATTIEVGITAGRWVFIAGAALDGSSKMRRAAFDDSFETGTAAFVNEATAGDNWLGCFTTKSSAGTLGIVAVRTTSISLAAFEGGGGFAQVSSATSLACYIGGIAYDTTSAQLEAESGSLLSGATAVLELGGASGAGNNHVELNALNEQVNFTSGALPAGSAVIAIFRIGTAGGGNASDILSLRIHNQTAAVTAASVDRNFSHFTAANTWYWQAVRYTSWNGTDTLFPYVIRTGVGASQDMYVDQCLWLTTSVSATDGGIDAVAAQALTEMTSWIETTRRVL